MVDTASDDQDSLVEALDAWFAVLRKRNPGYKVPLKPATQVELDQFAEVSGVDLPPDMVTLLEYTNGAWRDDDTPMRWDFMPNSMAFHGYSEHRHSPTETFIGIGGTLIRFGRDNGTAVFDFPPESTAPAGLPVREAVNPINDVFLFDVEGGEEMVTMIASPIAYQACLLMALTDGYWLARRVADSFRNVVELDRQGMLVWEGSGGSSRPYLSQDLGPMLCGGPWDPATVFPNGKFEYPGWLWEPLV